MSGRLADSREVDYLQPRPIPCHTLRYQTAVALLRRRLAAEEARGLCLEWGAVEDGGDVALVHQRLEAAHLAIPVAILAIVVADLGGRRQRRQMHVFAAIDLLEKPGQVTSLGEAGELLTGLEPDINHPLDAMLTQQRK